MESFSAPTSISLRPTCATVCLTPSLTCSHSAHVSTCRLHGHCGKRTHAHALARTHTCTRKQTQAHMHGTHVDAHIADDSRSSSIVGRAVERQRPLSVGSIDQPRYGTEWADRCTAALQACHAVLHSAKHWNGADRRDARMHILPSPLSDLCEPSKHILANLPTGDATACAAGQHEPIDVTTAHAQHSAL
jgi:hypothetical protein